MVHNVKCYYRRNGKLAIVNVEWADDYRHAVWSARSHILGEKEKWFEVKQTMMALVNK